MPRRRKKVRKFSFIFLFVTAAADEFRSERRDDDDEMSNGGGGGESVRSTFRRARSWIEFNFPQIRLRWKEGGRRI